LFASGEFDIHYSKFCGSLVLNSIKRSVINIQSSMLGVRCLTFNLITVPGSGSFIRAAPLAKKAASLIRKKLHFCNT